jgi:hypothetical protein
MGVSVAELCTMCEFDLADGPMIVVSEALFAGDLLVDEDYRVDGKIVSLVRRPSRTFCAVYLLTYKLALVDGAGHVAASCTNQWLLPRTREALS